MWNFLFPISPKLVPELPIPIHVPPSLPSGLVCCTCRALQRSPTYPTTLKEHAGYSEASIRNCVQVRAVPAVSRVSTRSNRPL